MQYKTQEKVNVGFGSLNSIKKISIKTTFLTQEEELKLIKDHQDGDSEAADRIIRSHMRLVVSLARKYVGYNVNEEELVQEGCLGVLEALNSFDISSGNRFSTFATHYIRGRMTEYILNNVAPIKIATTKNFSKIFFNMRRILKDLRYGKEEYSTRLTQVEIDKICEELVVKPEEVREMFNRMFSNYISIESSFDDEDDGGDSFGILDTHEDADSDVEKVVGEKLFDEKLHKLLPECLSSLDERSADIVRSRWLSESPSGLAELGAIYGISAERVRQVEAAAFKKMKKFFVEEGITSSH